MCETLAARMRLAIELIQSGQLFANVRRVSAPVKGLEQPLQEAEGGHCGDEYQPEPNEDKDLLIEEVYG